MAKKPSTPSADTKPYTATRAINHDGDLYPEGDSIDLTAEQAQPLLAVGAIVEKAAEAKS